MTSPSHIEALRSGATLVTANARLARAFRFAFDLEQQAAGNASWQAPDILPWSSWLERAWSEAVYSAPGPEAVLLGTAQERAVWECVIEADAESSGLLSVPATAAAAMEAYELSESWDLPRREADFAGFEDPSAFLRWAREFDERLERHGWLAAAHLPLEVCRRLEGGRAAAPRHLLYAGFDELTPRQRQVFASLDALGCRVEEATVQERPARTACRLGLRDPAAEMAAAAGWARALLEQFPEARIGVVVPELASMRALVERVFDDVLHPGVTMARAATPRAFHLSAGEPLTENPLTATALAILALDRKKVPLAEVGLLLRSVFLAGFNTEQSARARLDAELRALGQAGLSPAALAGHAERCECPELARRLRDSQQYRDQLPARQRAAEWSRSFSRLLQLAGWPGERPLASLEYQAVERWSNLLSEFAALDTVLPATNFASACGRLRRLAAEAGFAPEDRGAPIQIMGALEAAGASFDYLWVTGLDDRRWPAPPKPNPFLPIPLQRARGIPHSSAERELEYTRRLTARLLASAAEVVLSYPKREGDTELRPSPLIYRLPEAAAPPEADSVALTLRRDFPGLEEHPDPAGPPLAPGALQRGGTAVFEKQAQCPFRAFGEFRLQARPLEEPVPGLSPQERGILLHASLETMWGALKSHAGLVARTPPQRAQLVRDAVRAALGTKLRGRGAEEMPRIQALEQQRLERLLESWLEIESRRAPFVVVESERRRRTTIGGVTVDLQVDRVDRLPDGREIIIDYKSGRPSISGWEGDRPDAPQLPLYAATSKAPVAAVVFAQLRVGESCFRGLEENAGIGVKTVDGDLADRIGEWHAAIERLARDFAAGVAVVDPKDPCGDCHLSAVCRSSERPPRVLDDACQGEPHE